MSLMPGLVARDNNSSGWVPSFLHLLAGNIQGIGHGGRTRQLLSSLLSPAEPDSRSTDLHSHGWSRAEAAVELPMGHSGTTAMGNGEGMCC